MDLKQYCNIIMAYNNAFPRTRPCQQPTGINTLWVPRWSGNRTATLNLNHTINLYDSETGMAHGENGNDDMPYTIIKVPLWFTEKHVNIVAQELCIEMNKAANYPTIRVLKAERIEAIKRIISILQP